MQYKKPIIIGAGGLLEKDEKGRVTDILTRLREENNCTTYEVRISKICRNGNTIVCPINTWDKDAEAIIKTALQDPEGDTKRIGLVGSSLGAALLDHYIGTNAGLSGREVVYVAISPFTKVHPACRPYLEGRRNSQEDLEITSEIDKRKGIRRVIPHSDITAILDLDIPELFANLPQGYSITPLTIYGKSDERVDVGSILKRHKLLGGGEEDLIGFDCGHTTNPQKDRELATEFLKKHLLS